MGFVPTSTDDRLSEENSLKRTLDVAPQSGRASLDRQQERKLLFLAESAKCFPNIIVDPLSLAFRGSIQSREIAGYPITRLQTSGLSVVASPKKGVAAGLDGWMKLVWQFSGSSHFESDDVSFELKTGEATIMPMSEQYRLRMSNDYDGLMLVFDPSAREGWPDLLQSSNRLPVASNAAASAAGAALASILRYSVGDGSDKLAIDFALDALFRGLVDFSGGYSYLSRYPRLNRAVLSIEQNLGNLNFSPSDLAKAVGVSRRSLYQEFARVGLSPGSLIKRMRLDRAKRDILGSEFVDTALTEIALRNGFSDSSQFSHAFKQTFGISPSALRRSKAR